MSKVRGNGVDTRLARIEGQVRGISKMSMRGDSPVDMLTQIAAVRAALKKVSDIMVAEGIRDWVQSADSNRSAHSEVDELVRMFNINSNR